MRHLFIINPAAGKKESTPRLEGLLAKLSFDHEVVYTAGEGDAQRLTRQAAEEGTPLRVYACGGDGTLNEVAAGAAGYPNAAVTVYSGGSGNDFVKIFSDPKTFFSLDRLLDPEEVTFDMIRCNDSLALNICSVGLDARIGTDVASYKRLPFLQGFRAYAVSTLVNVVRGIGEHYVVEVNGESIDDELTFVCVCNGRFYGGGFNPVPEADPTDGILDVLLVKKVTRLQVPGLIGKYKSGRYRELGDLIRHFRTDKLTIRCDGDTPINLDGEVRRGQVVEMSVAKEKLRFFYPRGLSWQVTRDTLSL